MKQMIVKILMIRYGKDDRKESKDTNNNAFKKYFPDCIVIFC